MPKPIDYDRMAPVYDAGRAIPEEYVRSWKEALTPYLVGCDHAVLDLGSGTGLWAVLLAEWFHLDVIAIEPSSGMRAEAIAKRRHPHIRYLGGEDLPCAVLPSPLCGCRRSCITFPIWWKPAKRCAAY